MQQTELSTILNIQILFLLDFWATQYIISLQSQSLSLDNSGKPLSSVNACSLSPNLQLHLGGYLSLPKTVLPVAGLQYLLQHQTLVLFEATQSYINQLEFEHIIDLSVYARWSLDLQITKQRLFHWANLILILWMKFFSFSIIHSSLPPQGVHLLNHSSCRFGLYTIIAGIP